MSALIVMSSWRRRSRSVMMPSSATLPFRKVNVIATISLPRGATVMPTFEVDDRGRTPTGWRG
jgi:hypothetical protein